jgi:voltage-gated potassium channel
MYKFRKRLFEIVQIGAAKDILSRSFDVVISIFIILNIVVTFLATFNQMAGIMKVLKDIELITIIFFTVEYIARLFTADFLYPNKTKGKAVLAFIFSFYGIIDFLSCFPYYIPLATPTGLAVLRLFRVFRIFRLFKINSQFDAFNVIVNVLNERKKQLISSVVLILMLMLSASMLMYGVEHEAQPEVFENALSGFWWSMATVFTIGYGDIYPVTMLGKLLALIISFLGVGIVAIPTGIISAGFVEQFSQINRFKGHGGGHELEFITGVLNEDHGWCGKEIKDIVIPPQALIVTIVRDGENMTPTPKTVLKSGDTVVLATNNHRDDDINLNEMTVFEGDKWIGMEIENLNLAATEKIVMIKRGNKTIIPSANTVIKKNDALVMYHMD